MYAYGMDVWTERVRGWVKVGVQFRPGLDVIIIILQFLPQNNKADWNNSNGGNTQVERKMRTVTQTEWLWKTNNKLCALSPVHKTF